MTVIYRLFFCIYFVIIFLSGASGESGSGIVEYNTIIRVKDNNLTEEKSFLIQINDKQSDWLSDISILYDKNTKLDILEAFIINPNGAVVRKLNNKEIITKSYISDGSFFEDNMVKNFSLKWNEYPYRIKYSYRKTTNKFMIITSWYPLVLPNVSTGKASLSVQMPSDYKVNIYSSGNLNHTIDSLKDSYVLSWNISDVAPIRQENFAPPFQELVPGVRIVPKVFKYGVTGSFDNWSTFGLWQEEMNKNLVSLPYSEQYVVDTIVNSVSDKKEVIRRLYHYMQNNTRYINVTIDIGGFQPYPASYVSANKYGDCKALTIFMKALLKHAGINSFYTLIYAGSNPVRIKREFIAPQFNHVILCVPVEGDTLWLENTVNYLPCNYFGTFTQNRYGLLSDGNKSTLIKTPALRQEDVLEKSSYHFILNQMGTGKGYLTKEMHGSEFEKYAYLYNENIKEDQKSIIDDDLQLKNTQVTDWRISHSDRDIPYLNLKVEFTVSDQFRKIGNNLVINPIPINLVDFERPETRKYPVRINYPVNKLDSIVYELPFMEQYKLRLPDEVKIETKFGQYKEIFLRKDMQIIVLRAFRLYNGDYSLGEYPEFYSFIVSIKESEKKSVIILNQ